MARQRLTNTDRKIRSAQTQLSDNLSAIILAELQRLWRPIHGGLIRMNRQRPKLKTKRPLKKQLTISQDLWDSFKSRLRSKLLEAIKEGVITIASIQNAYLQGAMGETVDIDSGEFAEMYESSLGTMITQVTEQTQKEVAARVVRWYNTPGATMNDIVKELSPTFGRDRAWLIAHTETTRLGNAVEDEIASRLGITEWWWMSMRDELVCTKKLKGPDGAFYKGCRELHGHHFRVELLGPPDASHPGCRCRRKNVLSSRRLTKGWEETKHPRQKGGKFAPKGQGGTGSGAEEKPKKQRAPGELPWLRQGWKQQPDEQYVYQKDDGTTIQVRLSKGPGELNAVKHRAGGQLIMRQFEHPGEAADYVNDLYDEKKVVGVPYKEAAEQAVGMLRALGHDAQVLEYDDQFHIVCMYPNKRKLDIVIPKENLEFATTRLAGQGVTATLTDKYGDVVRTYDGVPIVTNDMVMKSMTAHELQTHPPADKGPVFQVIEGQSQEEIAEGLYQHMLKGKHVKFHGKMDKADADFEAKYFCQMLAANPAPVVNRWVNKKKQLHVYATTKMLRNEWVERSGGEERVAKSGYADVNPIGFAGADGIHISAEKSSKTRREIQQHEIGHFVQDNSRYNALWRNTWTSDGNFDRHSNYSKTNHMEGFAETYWAWASQGFQDPSVYKESIRPAIELVKKAADGVYK